MKGLVETQWNLHAEIKKSLIDEKRVSVFLILSNQSSRYISEIVVLQGYTPCSIIELKAFLKIFIQDWVQRWGSVQRKDTEEILNYCHDLWEQKKYSHQFLCVRFAWSFLMQEWLEVQRKSPIRRVQQSILVVSKEDWVKLKGEQVHTVKVKVGRYGIKNDIHLINEMMTLLPHSQFILDGNLHLSFDEANQLLSSINLERIVYIEDITKDLETWEKLKLKYKVRLAGEEMFRLKGCLSEWAKWVKKIPIDYIVCKPSQWGGIKSCQEASYLCQAYNKRLILSSCYEGKEAQKGVEEVYSYIKEEVHPIVGYGTFQNQEKWKLCGKQEYGFLVRKF